ncbi:glycosyltransferase family 2 protein [Gryllotalpicola reticulitermitis]|uniref:Glucosyl-3-phosphoglycerate synthase n=1 Tax=Gryllotalpicola reticulitermitis TaxID=1184153 RepID=A0ABV8Q8B5_9MICO
MTPSVPPQPADVDVSVIVCTRNRAMSLTDSIVGVLSALDALRDERLTGELVLVDNASDDATAEVVGRFARADARVRYVLAPEPGLGRARNVGVRAARGAVLLFTDDDIVVPRRWAVKMSEPLLSDGADVVFGGVAMAAELERPWMTDKLRTLYYAHTPEPRDIRPEPIGASMGARREVPERLPFDDALGAQPYPGAEDVLFRYQSMEAGYRVRGVRHVIVEHHFDAARLEPARLRGIAEGYGRCDAYLQHHHWPNAEIKLQPARLVLHWLRLKWIEARRPEPHSEQLMDAIRKVAFHREIRALRKAPLRYQARMVQASADAASVTRPRPAVAQRVK